MSFLNVCFHSLLTNFPNQIHTYHCGTDITRELCCAKENGKMLPFGFLRKKLVQISQRSTDRVLDEDGSLRYIPSSFKFLESRVNIYTHTVIYYH